MDDEVAEPDADALDGDEGTHVRIERNQLTQSAKLTSRVIPQGGANPVRRNLISRQLLSQIDSATALIDGEISENSDLTENDKFVLRLVRDNLQLARVLLAEDWNSLSADQTATRERALTNVQQTLEESPNWFRRSLPHLSFAVSAVNLINSIAANVYNVLHP
jgi:hypothetical protein